MRSSVAMSRYGSTWSSRRRCGRSWSGEDARPMSSALTVTRDLSASRRRPLLARGLASRGHTRCRSLTRSPRSLKRGPFPSGPSPRTGRSAFSLLVSEQVRLIDLLRERHRRVDARVAERAARVVGEYDHRDLRRRIGVVLLRHERDEPVVEAEAIPARAVLPGRRAELRGAGLARDRELEVRHVGVADRDDAPRRLADEAEILRLHLELARRRRRRVFRDDVALAVTHVLEEMRRVHRPAVRD